MKNKLLLLFLIISNIVFSYAQEYLPKSNGQIVKHQYYTFSYLEDYEQSEWVYYILTPKMLQGTTPRTNDFRVDPNVLDGSATKSDYKYSGYDRGHLAPAGDMKINDTAMSESFYLSNMSPQNPSFNRGIWKNLESLVRAWGKYNEVYVITGGVLTEGLEEIGVNEVDVPNYFYKVIYEPKSDKMIAFLLPNVKGEKELVEYVVSVDTIEELTSIDFFYELNDEKENQLEKSVNPSNWYFF